MAAHKDPSAGSVGGWSRYKKVLTGRTKKNKEQLRAIALLEAGFKLAGKDYVLARTETNIGLAQEAIEEAQERYNDPRLGTAGQNSKIEEWHNVLHMTVRHIKACLLYTSPSPRDS